MKGMKEKISLALTTTLLSFTILSSLMLPISNAQPISNERKADIVVEHKDKLIDSNKETKEVKEVNNDKYKDIVELSLATVTENTQVSNIKYANEGEEVAIVDSFDNYYEVVYDNDLYYLPKDNVLVTQKEVYDADNIMLNKRYVTTRGYLKDNVKLNINGKTKNVLKGEVLSVKDFHNGKYKVEYNNMTFDIDKDLVTFKLKELDKDNKLVVEQDLESLQEERLSKLNENEKIKGLNMIQEELINNGLKQLGTPYLAGSSDENKGLDASSFVSNLYEKSGITLPKDIDSLSNIGTEIKNGDQLKIGDLMFFGDKGKDQVAIYIGGEQIIHSNKKLGVVSIDNVYKDSISKDLYKVVRILN